MRGIKLIKTGLASLLIAVGAFVAVAALDPSGQANAAKCSTNDVIDCGVTSMAELRDRYNSDYTKGTKAIYSYFGINSDTVNKGAYKQGTLYRDGRVVVDGKTVATGAHTVGREFKAGSEKHTSGGYTFYSGTADVRFVRDVRPVFVFFDENGVYSSAIMLDCGNPVVKAKPSAPKPTYECKTLAATKITRTKYEFKTTVATSGGAAPISYAYDFGDGTTQTANSSTISHEYNQPGTYTAKVTVTFKANGVNQPATDRVTCIVKVTVEEEPKPEPKYIEVCRLEDKTYPVRIKEEEFDETLHSKDPADCKEEPKYIDVCRLEDKKYPVRIKEDEFDATLHSKNPEDCKEEEKPKYIKVCRLEDKKYPVRIKEDEFDASLHSKDPADCKEEPKYIDVCRLEDKKYPVTIREEDFDATLHSKNSDDCKEKEKPPVKGDQTELPQTGLGETLSGVIGMGAITTAVYYYATSRRL